MLTQPTSLASAMTVAELMTTLEDFADECNAPICKQKIRELSLGILEQIESYCESKQEDMKIIEMTKSMMRDMTQQSAQCIAAEIKNGKNSSDKALEAVKRGLTEARLNFSTITSGAHSLKLRTTTKE